METQVPVISSCLKNIGFQAKPSPELELIERELEQVISGSDGTIQEMCRYLFSSGGKRVRPLMALYSGLIFSGETPQLLQAAVAVELIHMATLVHDDIIDEAGCRHGRPTVHRKWGFRHALLCGDYLFTKAFGILSENNPLSQVPHLMAEAIGHMCKGELLQADDQFNCDIDMERYYERITQKTAIFIQYICMSGAMIGGATPEQIKLLGDFGLHFGIAFQIGDDIMDFFGDLEEMGKPKHEDFRHGNLTLPVILALNNPKYGAWLKEIIVKREFSEPVLIKIEDILKETGSLNKAFQIAALHIEWCKYCLARLPNSPYVQSLENMADKLPAGNTIYKKSIFIKK